MTTVEFPTHVAQLIEEGAKTTISRQDVRAAAPDEVVVNAIFHHFQYYDSITKKNVQTRTPPAIQMKSGKKKTGENTSYPVNLEVMAQVKDIPLVQGHVQPRTDGGHGWLIKSHVDFSQKASDWLKANCAALYAGHLDTDFPYSLYIREDGELIKDRWVTVSNNQVIKFKVNGGAKSLFREKVDKNDKSDKRLVVTPQTAVRFPGIKAVEWVDMREIKNDQEEKKDEQTIPLPVEEGEPPVKKAAPSKELRPVSYFWFKSKGVPSVLDDSDRSMPETERIHALEKKDVHNMIPVADLRAGRSFEKTVFFYVDDKYLSSNPTNDPNVTGIHLGILPVENTSDLSYTPQEGETKYKKVVRFTVFQWVGKPSYNDQYSVVIRSGPETWRAFGIMSGEDYGMILQANHDISLLVRAELNVAETRNHDFNDPSKINNRPDQAFVKGNYFYYAKDLVPDYLRWLEKGAVPLTKDAVISEFEGHLGQNKKTGATTLPLEPADKTRENLLHTDGINSPVICLGRADQPSFNGNAWPLFEGDTHNFYVLTSHRLTPEERLAFTKVPASTATDDFFMRQRTQMKVEHYAIFAVKKGLPMAKDYIPVTFSDPEGGETPVIGQKRERE